MPVAYFEGSIVDIARAHGALLKRFPQAISGVEFYGQRVQQYLEQSTPLAQKLAQKWPLRSLMTAAYRLFLHRPLLQNMPVAYERAYREFAKAAGLDATLVLDALFFPDALLRLAGATYGKETVPGFLQGAPSFGCTSIILNKDRSSVLHGRNLDYEGQTHWEAHPLIVHSLPSQGLAHVWTTALGIHAPGITGFNEANVSLAVHQLTLSDSRAYGTPMPVIAAEILRNARSIDQAISIIQNFPRTSGWAYVVSHGLDRAVIETSANELSVRRSSAPAFFQTNHVSSPALQSLQYFYSPGSWLDSLDRFDFLSERLHSKRPQDKTLQFNPPTLARLLENKSRLVGSNIRKLDNVQSVMMDPASRALWIEFNGEWLRYQWSDLRSALPPTLTTRMPAAKSTPLWRVLRNAQGLGLGEQRKKAEALLAARPAWAALADKSGTWGYASLLALSALQSGVGLEPSLAVLTESLASDRELRNTSKDSPKHRRSALWYLQGAVLDSLGRRDEAAESFAKCAANAIFVRVKNACARHALWPFTPTDGRALRIDWAGADTMTYP